MPTSGHKLSSEKQGRAATVAWFCLALIAFTARAGALTYDFSTGFSATNNPSGVWSMGWKATATGTLSLLTVQRVSTADNGVKVPSWQLTSGLSPSVFVNTSGQTATIQNGQDSLAPGEAWFNSGDNGLTEAFAVVRFTVPAAGGGSYLVSTAVAPVHAAPNQGDTDFHVVINGTEVFGQWLAPADTAGHTNQVTLAAGDTVDFVVGRGNDGSGTGSGLRLRATVQTSDAPPPDPEPEIHYDLFSGFSGGQNPNKPWSFGWKETLAGTFTSLTAPHLSLDENGLPIPSWQYTSDQLPAVYANTNASTAVFNGGAGHAGPGTIWFSAGENGTVQEYGAIRFTVPAAGAGTYRIATGVQPIYDQPTVQGDTDFHVVVNGREVFQRWLAPSDSASYTNELSLGVGDTVDFLIGRGADENVTASGLMIAASVTPATPGGAPIIVTQPLSQTLTNGSPYVLLSVGAEGAAPLHYQWFFNNSPMSGKTDSVLRLTNVQSIISGAYSVKVTNTVGMATSDTAILLVTNPAPTVVSNDLATGFSPSLNPSGAWSYGWKGTVEGTFTLLTVPHVSTANNGVLIPSWQLTSDQTPAIYANTSGQTATFGGGQGSAAPGEVWFYGGENGRPENFGVIRYTVPPAAGDCFKVAVAVSRVYSGEQQGDTDFHVVINGAEVFGQWLAPADTAEYTNHVELNAGDTIDFVVGRGADGNAYGSGLRILAGVSPLETPNGPPVILAGPEGQTATAGTSATFSVGVSGAAPLHYQWYFNDNTLPNATNSVLVLNHLQAEQAGNYSVVVTNLYGTATSAEAELAVLALADFDVSRDFSLSGNPNGPWSYGAQSTPGGPLVLLETSVEQNDESGTLIQSWQFGPYEQPAVFCNLSSETAYSDGGLGVYPPGTVWMVPDAAATSNNFAVIRLTIPDGADGSYRLFCRAEHYRGGDDSSDSDFHVLFNGVEVFGRNINPGEDVVHTNLLVLAAGDTVDFLAGRGADDVLFGSGLKLEATLTMIYPGGAAARPEKSEAELKPPTLTGGNTVHLQFTGTPGQTYIVQTSTDLKTWTSLGTATETSTGKFEFAAPKVDDSPHRFYRAVAP